MLDAARCDASIRKAAPVKPGTHVGALDEPALQPANDANLHPLEPPEPVRARNATPPAVRRRVLERDRRRCQIPGCRNTLDLDVHHILPRADGGTHDPDDLTTICGGHHRAVHAGRLHLSGTASALRVSHADGSPYGATLGPAATANADTSEKVFGGLRWLGYKETEAKRALGRALADHPDPAELTEQSLLKRALALLRRCGGSVRSPASPRAASSSREVSTCDTMAARGSGPGRRSCCIHDHDPLLTRPNGYPWVQGVARVLALL